MRSMIGELEQGQLRKCVAQTEQMRAQAQVENQDMVDVLVQVVQERFKAVWGTE